jgi:hypothetical protein
MDTEKPNSAACRVCRSQVPCDCSTWKIAYRFLEAARAALRTVPSREHRHA